MDNSPSWRVPRTRLRMSVISIWMCQELFDLNLQMIEDLVDYCSLLLAQRCEKAIVPRYRQRNDPVHLGLAHRGKRQKDNSTVGRMWLSDHELAFDQCG